MAFLRKWEAQRDLEDPFHRDEYELNGIDYLLSNCGYLDYKMGGIYIDGERRLSAWVSMAKWRKWPLSMWKRPIRISAVYIR